MTGPTFAGPGGLRGSRSLTGPATLGFALNRRRWLAAVATAALASLVLLPLAPALLADGLPVGAPTRIADARLAGPRGPECLRLVVAPDRSGSMEQYSAARDSALKLLLPWARTQLRADDEVAVIEWADRTAVVLAPTPVGAAATSGSTGPGLGTGTHLAALVAAVATLARTTCRTQLVLISDGEAADLPDSADLSRLAPAGIDVVTLLMPAPGMRAPRAFTQALPYARASAFNGLDPQDTALALARTIASTTGQRIERR